MLAYCFATIHLNGRKIREPFDLLLPKSEIPTKEKELTKLNGHDTFLVYAEVKDESDAEQFKLTHK